MLHVHIDNVIDIECGNSVNMCIECNRSVTGIGIITCTGSKSPSCITLNIVYNLRLTLKKNVYYIYIIIIICI